MWYTYMDSVSHPNQEYKNGIQQVVKINILSSQSMEQSLFMPLGMKRMGEGEAHGTESGFNSQVEILSTNLVRL